MHLFGKYLTEVSFPVGGIGAGCIGIDGQGRLSEWEIFNSPGKKRDNYPSHFAIRAERKEKVVDARILNGPIDKDFQGLYGGKEAMFWGFGWGPSTGTMCGFPHFKSVRMNGEFPAAEYFFSDPDFPGKVKLTAWSPFIPGESDLSSLPCAIFEIELTNTTSEPIDYTGLGVLTQFRSDPEETNTILQENGLSTLLISNNRKTGDTEFGELALTTDAENVSYQEAFYRGQWQDSKEVYSRELMMPGPFKNRHYEEKTARNDVGLLAGHCRVEPGKKAVIRFIISWYFPLRSNTWERPAILEEQMKQSGIRKNLWKNYYAKLCSSARNGAEQIFADYARIRKEVFSFRKELHSSSLPSAALVGAAENLAVLISPTCLRLEDGTFWGFEGVGPGIGSCPGTCQHVWNYAQALSLLFPDLERTIRESMFRYNFTETGGLNFRLQLPLGTRYPADSRPTCADGAFGEIMKTFREWKVSGDTRWLKKMWPSIKRILEHAWDKKNKDQWDPGKTGLLSGRQHHTLDMELFGPSGWLQSHYLGALKAASIMGEACGEPEFAKECLSLFQKGRSLAEKELFNGKYYIQKVDLTDRNVLKKTFRTGETMENNPYWDAEHKELKYQIQDGCSIDSHLGQWYASLYGIGEILDPKQIRTTLKSIFRYNYKSSMRKFLNTWRIYSLNEEAGTIMCSWPEGTRKPVIPLPYNTETMTGFEWAFACHSVMTGETEQGETVAKAIRDRYDGAKRNPWNEIECGSNYARSMAAYGMLQAYSGFQYDMTCGRIGFQPVLKGDFRCFWALGNLWGRYERKGAEESITILHGSGELKEFALSGKTLYLNGKKQKTEKTDGSFRCCVRVKPGTVLTSR